MNFEVEESQLASETFTKKYEEYEIKAQKIIEELYSNYNDQLKRNKELKREVAILDLKTQDANKMFNTITNELKENQAICKEKKRQLEKLKADNQADKKSEKSTSCDETLDQMETIKLKKLNDTKLSFCIYKELFGLFKF